MFLQTCIVPLHSTTSRRTCLPAGVPIEGERSGAQPSAGEGAQPRQGSATLAASRWSGDLAIDFAKSCSIRSHGKEYVCRSTDQENKIQAHEVKTHRHTSSVQIHLHKTKMRHHNAPSPRTTAMIGAELKAAACIAHRAVCLQCLRLPEGKMLTLTIMFYIKGGRGVDVWLQYFEPDARKMRERSRWASSSNKKEGASS